VKIFGEQGLSSKEEKAREQLVGLLQGPPPSIERMAHYFHEEDYTIFE
jgi:hypothetical protein